MSFLGFHPKPNSIHTALSECLREEIGKCGTERKEKRGNIKISKQGVRGELAGQKYMDAV